MDPPSDRDEDENKAQQEAQARLRSEEEQRYREDIHRLNKAKIEADLDGIHIVLDNSVESKRGLFITRYLGNTPAVKKTVQASLGRLRKQVEDFQGRLLRGKLPFLFGVVYGRR